MTGHREQLKEYLSAISLENKNVIDWGSGAKPAMRYVQHKDCRFTTIDKNSQIPHDRRADIHIIADICESKFIDHFDVAFCLEVIEHVKSPDDLLDNIRDNLRYGGILYLSVPFLFPIHGDEDYWRFTEAGLRLLLEDWAGFTVNQLITFDDQSGYFVEAKRGAV